MSEQPIDTRQLGWEVIQGNALDVLPGMPAGSVDCVVTSPPYWGLRDYGEETVVDWPDGWRGQLGLEPHPALYLEHLWAVFDEIKRVLKPTGTVWVNMGDTYGSRCWGKRTGGRSEAAVGDGVYARKDHRYGNFETAQPPDGDTWFKPKNLLMIPARFAIGMQGRGWWLRNDICWHKPNAMPSSVKDRFSCTWEHIFFFTKAARYAFDLDAARVPQTCGHLQQQLAPNKGRGESKQFDKQGLHDFINPLGKNPGDCWIIPTFAFSEAHFAVYPPELIRKPIRAGCPPKVCVECGTPWQRIVEEEREPRGDAFGKREPGEGLDHGQAGSAYQQVVERKTIGWEPTCDCGGETEPGMVLDPFCGSGTTGIVAREELRRFTGIDLAPAYRDMSIRRLSELLPL